MVTTDVYNREIKVGDIVEILSLSDNRHRKGIVMSIVGYHCYVKEILESKKYNCAELRIINDSPNKELCEKLEKLKSNLDSLIKVFRGSP